MDLKCIYLPLSSSYKSSGISKNKQFDVLLNKPFFSIINENGVFRHFVEELKNSDEDAKTYLSKYQNKDFDLNELKEVFNGADFKVLFNFFLNKKSNGIVVATDAGVFKVSLTTEPDNFGKWKIFKIEKE